MISLRFYDRITKRTLFEKTGNSSTLVVPRAGEMVIFLPDGSGERVQYVVKMVTHVHTKKDTIVEVFLDRSLPLD